MAQLSAIVDELLSDVSSMTVPKGYQSEALLPYVPSKHQTGKLAKYGQQHLRIESSLKGGRGQYRRVESIVRSQDSYSIDGHGLEGMVTKEDYKNVMDPYKAEEDETLGITAMLWLEKEQVLANAITNTSTITQFVTLGALQQYNDYANSDPVGDSQTAAETIMTGVGVEMDTMLGDFLVINRLRNHPGILDAIGFKYARPGGLKDDELARAFNVERILVAKARYNSAKEGQTDALSPVWGKDLLFCAAPNAASRMQISVGYWIGYEGESPRKVYKEDQFNPPGSTKILVEDNYAYMLTNVKAAYLVKAAVA